MTAIINVKIQDLVWLISRVAKTIAAKNLSRVPSCCEDVADAKYANEKGINTDIILYRTLSNDAPAELEPQYNVQIVDIAEVAISAGNMILIAFRAP